MFCGCLGFSTTTSFLRKCRNAGSTIFFCSARFNFHIFWGTVSWTPWGSPKGEERLDPSSLARNGGRVERWPINQLRREKCKKKWELKEKKKLLAYKTESRRICVPGWTIPSCITLGVLFQSWYFFYFYGKCQHGRFQLLIVFMPRETRSNSFQGIAWWKRQWRPLAGLSVTDEMQCQ